MEYIKYKTVEDYTNYIIFRTGKIYSKYKNKFIKPYKNNKGYLIVDLIQNKIRKKFLIHRLLSISFIDNINNYDEVDHIDRNPLNNNLNNLRWATRRQQILNRNINKNNTLGHRGISYNEKHYRGRIFVNNKEVSRSYSISKYGKEKALQLAIKFRKDMEEKYYNYI